MFTASEIGGRQLIRWRIKNYAENYNLWQQLPH